jgi:hypothetical protein
MLKDELEKIMGNGLNFYRVSLLCVGDLFLLTHRSNRSIQFYIEISGSEGNNSKSH